MNRRAFLTAIAAALGLRAKAKALPSCSVVVSAFNPHMPPNAAWVFYDCLVRAGYDSKEMDLPSFVAAAKMFDEGATLVPLGPLCPRISFRGRDAKLRGELSSDFRGFFQNI